MRSRTTTSSVLVALLVVMLVAPAIPSRALMMSYSPVIQGGSGASAGTVIEWNVTDCPDVPFSWGWSSDEKWLTTPGEKMVFSIENVTDDIEGILTIGNLTVNANDTSIARELVLGVWGKTQFFPGLVIETDSKSINALNETAYAAAARVKGNYLNGTMESRYEDIAVRGHTYSCIVFDYEQDPTPYGESQRTTLAYDTESGVLVWANSSYSFGTPYVLTLELARIVTPATGLGPVLPLVVVGVVAVVVVAVMVATRVLRR